MFDSVNGYFIEQELYHKHKEYLDKNIPFTFDFDLFVYSVSFTSVEEHEYKKDCYEELPPLLE